MTFVRHAGLGTLSRLRSQILRLDPFRRALYVLLWLLLLALLVRAFIGALTSFAFFSHPFQLDESEGMIVAETMLLDKGAAIYEIPTADLFVAAPYPPLFYLLNWPVQHLAGDTPTFKGGRAFSLAATLLAGIAIMNIVRTLTRNRFAGAIGAAAWWSLGLVTFWGALVKPDMLALALGLGGLWWLVARPPLQMWWALAFFWGAFYTKQTAIAAAVAAIAWLLVTRPKRGLVFGLVYVAGAALPYLLLDLITSGGYFYHMFTVHDLPWSAERALGFLENLIGAYTFLLVPGTLALISGALLWLRWRARREPRSALQDGLLLLLFYFVMSLFAASGTGTLGGNHNHLLDLVAAAALGLGLGVHLVWTSRRREVLVGGIVIALLILAQVPLLFAVPPWLKLEFGMLSAEKVSAMNSISQYVTNDAGEAYSDNVGLLLTAGKTLWSTDPYTQTHATFFKRWNESRLVDAIRRRRFSQVILRIDIDNELAQAGDVSPAILQAVRDNYKLDKRNVLNIYVPK